MHKSLMMNTVQSPINVKMGYFKLVGAGTFVKRVSSTSVTLGRALEQPSREHISLGHGKNISRLHARISWNPEVKKFEFHCLSKNGCYVNGKFVNSGSLPVPLQSRSLLQISNQLLYFLLPGPKGEKDDKAQVNPDEPVLPRSASFNKWDVQRCHKWKKLDRDKFKVAFLTWGYGRWDRIRAAVGQGRNIAEIEVYAMHFIAECVRACAPAAKKQAVAMATVLRDATKKAVPPARIDQTIVDWPALAKNAKKWAAKICNMYDLNMAIRRYGEENFMENLGVIPGRPPALWWGPVEDRDLLRGIYTHGWGAFEQIKCDMNLTFHKRSFAVPKPATKTTDSTNTTDDETAGDDVDNSGANEENDPTKVLWPSQNSLLSRFKKVIEAIRARDEQLDEFSIDEPSIVPEEEKIKIELSPERPVFSSKKKEPMKRRVDRSGWSKRDKQTFVKALMNFGHPKNWATIRTYSTNLQAKTPQQLENRYRILVQDMKRMLRNGGSKSMEHELPVQTAKRLRERLSMFDLLQNKVLNHRELDERLKYAQRSYDLPSWWNSAKYDKALMKGVIKHGIERWDSIYSDAEFPFSENPNDIKDTKVILTRLKYLLTLFKAEVNLQHIKNSHGLSRTKSRRSGDNEGTEVYRAGKKIKLVHVNYDGFNNPIMPVEINPSLSILNLGVVDFQRPAYHSHRYIFPIGFKSVREHPSMLDPTKRCKYYSEIMDGGKAPFFRVTCEADPSKHIDATSTSAAWLVIDKAIDRLKTKKRKTVSVSGTERFGLAEPTVIKLIQELDNAEKCTRYIRRDLGPAVVRVQGGPKDEAEAASKMDTS